MSSCCERYAVCALKSGTESGCNWAEPLTKCGSLPCLRFIWWYCFYDVSLRCADKVRIDPEDTGETQASFSFVDGKGRNWELLVGRCL